MNRANTLPRRPRPWGRRAYSLLEVSLVIALVGVIAMVAVPKMANSLARQRVRQAAFRVVADLTVAQARASALSASQTIEFSSASARYRIAGMTDPDNPASMHMVHLGGEPFHVRIESADFGGNETLIFDGFGYPDSGGTIVLTSGSVKVSVNVDPNTGTARIE